MSTANGLAKLDSAKLGRKARRAAALAFFVDAFDAYAPELALAPAQAYFFPSALPAATHA